MNTTLQLSRIIDSVNNELTDHMNFFSKVFFLALFLFQRPCWKPSPHRKANKCHGVGVLETWPSLPIKWVWLSKMAWVGPKDFGDLNDACWWGVLDCQNRQVSLVGGLFWVWFYLALNLICNYFSFYLEGIFRTWRQREVHLATPWYRVCCEIG